VRHCRGSSDLDAFPAADPAESEVFGCKVFYKLHGISKLDDANDTMLNVREATHKQVDIYYCTLDSVNFDPSKCR